MYKKLFKKDLGMFTSVLNKFGKLYAPVKKTTKLYEFTELTDFKELQLNYTRTMIPPKNFFLKSRETLYLLNKDEGFKEITDDSKVVLLGVHSCDINALNLLDQVYLNQFPDLFYQTRRNNTIIIGVSCEPDEYCFCTSTGSTYALKGFDLFMYEIDDSYILRVGSLRGYQIISESKGVISDVLVSDIKELKKAEEKRVQKISLNLNVNGIQDILDLSYDHPAWQENADICFGCGSCNLVCPTCRCYDVADYLKLDLKNGLRVRRWDSCMLKQHGLVAGGHNFRPTRVERLYNRFNCKMSFNEDFLNCVGCGRCTVYCPADINFVEVLKQVRED